jgi:HK97 family phage major capsid protein
MKLKPHEAREQRSRLLAEARQLLERCEAERRELTADEAARFDALHGDAQRLLNQARRQEAQERTEAEQVAREYERERAGHTGEGRSRILVEGAGLFFMGAIRHSTALMDRGLALMGVEESEARAALQEGTAAEGGYLVPTPMRAEVLRLVKDYGIARRLATVLPMDSQTLSVPDIATKPAVTIVAEEGTIQQSEPTFGQNLLTAKKLIAYSVVSRELQEDAAPEIGQLLLTEFAEAIAGLEDQQALEGDGTGNNFTGLKTALSGSGQEVSGAALGNLDPFINAMALVAATSAAAAANGSWVFHPYAWATVTALKHPQYSGDTAGNYQLNPTPARGQALTLLGRPVFLSDQIEITSGTPDASSGYFGDFRRGLLMGDRNMLSIFLDPYSSSTTWQTKVYVGERVAINVAQPGAFVEITSIPSDTPS